MNTLRLLLLVGLVACCSINARADVVSSNLVVILDSVTPVSTNLNTAFGGQQAVQSWAVYDGSGVGPSNTFTDSPAAFGNISFTGNGLLDATADTFDFDFNNPTNPTPGSGDLFGHSIDWQFTIGGPVSLSVAVTPNIRIGDSGAIRVYGQSQLDAVGGSNFGGGNNFSVTGIGNAVAGDQSFAIPGANTQVTWIYELLFDDYQGETINFTHTQPNLGGFDLETSIAGVAVATVPEPTTALFSSLLIGSVVLLKRRR